MTALLITSCRAAPPASTPTPSTTGVTVRTLPAEEPVSTSTTLNTAPSTTTAPDSWTYVGIDGTETEISDTSRMVTLNGDLNEIVYALGFGEWVVGNDVSATFPPETLDLPKIGYQRALNSEGILSLAPTLVIGNQQAGPPEVLEQVRSAGVPVVILPDQTSLDGAARKVVMVGEVLGVPDQAAQLADRINQEIDAAHALVPDLERKPRIAFIYARGPGVMFLAGHSTPSESLITAAGGVDAGAEAGIVDFLPMTPEGLAAANPDWLILTHDGLESLGGLEGLLAIPGVGQTPAGRQGRVLTFDDLGFLGLTPRVGEILKSLISALYAEE